MFEELLTPPPRALPSGAFAQLRRAVMPVLAAGAALVVMALAAQVALRLQHHQAQALAERGASAEGIVVDKLSGRYLMRLTVAYSPADHRFHSVRQWVRPGPGDRWLLLGNRVRVFYDPANPDRAYVEQLARRGGSLTSSVPVVSLTGMVLLLGGLLLAAGGWFTRTAHRLLRAGTLLPARITRAASWRNLWLGQFEVAQDDKTRTYRGFVPPGWRAASAPGGHAALVDSQGRALLLIEPSPEDF